MDRLKYALGLHVCTLFLCHGADASAGDIFSQLLDCPGRGCPAGPTALNPGVLPEIGGTLNQLGKAGSGAINKLQAGSLTGPALEQAIITSRNTAINGSMPIPPQIRQQLTGYASEDSMNRVRFKIGDNGFVNLARLLEAGNPATAVTLIDVVIFPNGNLAASPSLWAHALLHVDQYAAWGVHSFALQYARSPNSVEAPAYAKENGYEAWLQQRRAVPNTMGFGQFCYVGGLRYGPGPAQPTGSPCHVGNNFGQIGQ
jgi:hypothetical protein